MIEILSIDVDLSTALVKESGTIRQLSYTQLSGVDPAECIRRQYDPAYKWLSFRRAVIASPEYPLSIALSNQNQAVAVADAKLGLAIDCCFAHRGAAPEVAACRSALALYLSVLPSTTEGQAVAARLTALMEEYGI